MLDHHSRTEEIKTYCALCISRCGARATVEDGRLKKLAPDKDHPTGQALCIKGKVAPELVYSPDRLLYPMKRTRPKGHADPGWERISWDEALETIAYHLSALAQADGPESVAFITASPSTSAIDDSIGWIRRLRRAFGSPNQAVSMELCGWGRWLANIYTYGTSFPAGVMPDLENTDCILYWGYNPSVSRIAHATATVAAKKRGAKLIVVDPRNAGLARRADAWLRVRPGSDGALALGLSHVMIKRGWYDAAFLCAWTNAPALVREDNGRLLRAGEIGAGGAPDDLVVWSKVEARPRAAKLGDDDATQALFGAFEVATLDGTVSCRPVFQRWMEICAEYVPETVEEITTVPSSEVERAAEMLWRSRPVAYMAWSGVEQQSNATQIARAVGLLHALTGGYDVRGGNVEFPSVPTNDVQGDQFLSEEQRAKTLGLSTRPLGPARHDYICSADVYKAILENEPYAVRGLVSFGSNLVMAHADGETADRALQALSFHVHADLFMNPSAQHADIVLPVATPFETEGLKAGFEINEAACGLIQLRKPLVAPQGEARSDTQIVFDLACRMGLGNLFWDGDVDAGLREFLGPSGVTLEALRAAPEGVRMPLETRYRKYAETENERPRGFNTPSRRVEFYSEVLLDAGHPPLPDYEEPLVSHRADPKLARRFPLILTCAKDSHYCESQHRNIPSLRRRAPDPQVDLHPAAAKERGVGQGDWVEISTPHGVTRARARFDESLAENVVCGQHGWWQACPEIDAPGYPAVGSGNANYNLVIGHDAVDPVSGSVPLRAYVCQVARIAQGRNFDDTSNRS